MTADAQRLHFVQWLRVFLIALVVAHHAGQPYGPTGGEWPIDDPVSASWLGAFFSFNAAFFMGFFFFLAGYFVAGSYHRKGLAGFTLGRLLRLGLPLVLFVFLVFGPITYLTSNPGTDFATFYGSYVFGWNIEMGHLWFIAQLLAYSLLYALWRASPLAPAKPLAIPLPRDRHILGYALLLGVVGGAVRLSYPQDRWIDIFWTIPAEPAHLPQYVSMFVLGAIAGPRQWLSELPTGTGLRWLGIGIGAFVVSRIVPYPLLPSWVAPGFVWGLLEAFVCVGLIVGLSVVFRNHLNAPSRWARALDGQVYGVYIIHVFIVVAIQGALLPLAWPASAKFVAVTALGLVMCFAITAALRAIPGVRSVV